MSRRLLLHVGAMKSGTSFIQSRLFANKPMLLEERGILVPGMNWLSQVMAARDVLGSGEDQWAKMAGKVNAHVGTSGRSVLLSPSAWRRPFRRTRSTS